MKTKRLTELGLLTALALILFIIEIRLPNLVPVPGVKLGLANLAVVFVLYGYGWKEAGIVSFVRILAVGFLFGSLFSILYSLAGGILSLAVMAILKKRSGLSMVGVSIAGGVSHNIGQIFVAMAVVESFSLAYYLPILLVSGVLTGLCIGFAALEVWKRIGKNIE